MSYIEDGTGKGFKAKVSSQNHLQVDSVSVEEITHISSTEGGAYTLHMGRAVAAAATTEEIGHFTYNGDYKLQVDSLIISREDVALNTAGQAVVSVVTNTTHSSGGAIATPTNMNLASTSQLDAVVHSGSVTLVTDNTNSVIIADVAFRDTYDFHLDGSLILNKGDTMAFRGKSKNIGDTIHIVLTVYEVKEVI
jgi:hypothetical protein